MKPNFEKKSLNAEKTERLTLWGFSTSILSQNSENIEEDPKFSRKKVSQCQKTEGGPFGLVRYCMLRGKTFWFSSLGQRVQQFGVLLKFCRTSGVELFWSLQVYRKKIE